MYEARQNKQNKEKVSRRIDKLQEQRFQQKIYFHHQPLKKSLVVQRGKQGHHVIPRCLADFLWYNYGVDYELLEGKTIEMEQNSNHPTYSKNIEKAISLMTNVDQLNISNFADNLIRKLRSYNQDVDPDSVPFNDIFSCIPVDGNAQNPNQCILITGRKSSPLISGSWK